ncbi:carbohydrate sulfotransferase 15-like [Biomphalaria glabrata]|uniref:Carbohydrate sulfotransferase 15-like n=1 Tax=Biomphalaria glabrata TaxID=6526 RepID=A0A9W3AYR2_BIOGL|nr:carbohydrate sulfotransferase 15-like [Biomphalaria glabrata]
MLRQVKKVFLVLVGILTMTFVVQHIWVTSKNVRQGLVAWSSKEVQSIEKNPCIDRRASEYNRVEDIYCIVLPEFLPHLKNPCFYDIVQNGTKSLRCLPYFYILGIDKSGSTDFHNRLTKHPQVYGNLGTLDKETEFWSWKRYGFAFKRKIEQRATLDFYLDLFSPLAGNITARNETNLVTGDATPMDVYDFRGWPMIPQNEGLQEPRILTPHLVKYIHGQHRPKFIIIFREPIERLYSDYVFLKYGKDPEEFHQHVVLAITMMKECIAMFSRRFCFFDDDLLQKLPVRIHVSCYSVFLKEWLQVFPRSVFHIIRTTEYANEMETTLKEAFHFLELPSVSPDIMQDMVNEDRRHETANKTSTVLPETRALLRTYYSTCNEEMAELLDDQRFLWLDHYS